MACKYQKNLNVNEKIFKTYVLKKKLLIEDNIKFIYIDESSFNNQKRQKRMWVPKHAPSFYLNNGRIKSLNLILAITNKKIENYFINKMSNNGESFLCFLKHLVQKFKSSEEYMIDYNNGQYCIYMDNTYS